MGIHRKFRGALLKAFLSELAARTQSGKFVAYATGLKTHLSTGEEIFLKIERTEKSIRPRGLRFSKHAFVTEVSAGSDVGFGYGESPTQILALQKSIAEGIERAVYRIAKGTAFGTRNSNGWAAHLNSELAAHAATEELIERDAILVHWLRQHPMQDVLPSTWPQWLRRWVNTELAISPLFNQLRVLTTTEGHLPTVTTALLDRDGYGVSSHATASTLESAVVKALTETCRIAQIAMELRHETGIGETAPSLILDHIRFYAFKTRVPQWLFGKSVDWKLSTKKWEQRRRNFRADALQIKFHQVTSGPLVVGYATSGRLQGLYFGETATAIEQGFINFNRLNDVGFEGTINLQPHWVA